VQHGLPARPLRRHRQSIRDVTVSTPDCLVCVLVLSRGSGLRLRLGLKNKRLGSVSRPSVWYGFRSAGKSFAISAGLEAKVSVWDLGNGLNGSSPSQSSSRRRSLV